MKGKRLEICDLGVTFFGGALEIMDRVHADVCLEKRPPTLLVTQHQPVITMGQRKLHHDLSFSLSERSVPPGVDYFEIDRGGSATAHEPGQLVIYPILPIALFGQSVRSYVSFLEEEVIQTCASFGVSAARDCINPGVWCGERKIAALGVRVKDRVTRHGLAFNLVNSLETFSWIVPCGLQTRGVTSLARELSVKGQAHPGFEEAELYEEARSRLLERLQARLLKAPGGIQRVEMKDDLRVSRQE